MSRAHCRCTFVCVLLVLAFGSQLGAQQLPPGMKLDRVEVQGSSLFTPPEIEKMSGLQRGQNVDMATLSKAASTLAGWGYFSAVRFAYRYTGTNLTVSFQLQEQARLLEALFDNFVSVRDDEIRDAIRKDYPSFAGKVPGTGAANAYIQQKIESLLAENGTPATVNSIEVTGTGQAQMVFRQDNDTPICAVRLQRVDGNAEPELVAASAKLQKEPYSRQRIGEFVNTDLLAAARKRGYWRFELLEASASTDPASCSPGATVVLRFRSGSAYSWGSAFWNGNQKQTTARLDELSGMRRGDIADVAKIESGLLVVVESYLSSGFLDFVMTPRPEQDDPRREVNYRIQVKEGEQYRMGEFACNLPAGAGSCDSIKSQWKIRSGDILDGTYFDQFRNGAFAEWKKRTVPASVPVNIALQRNSATRVANVFVFVPVPR